MKNINEVVSDVSLFGSVKKSGSPVVSFRCPTRYQDAILKAKVYFSESMPEVFDGVDSVPDAFVVKCALELLLDIL